ncbi:MAG: glycosyltransferase [Floccifex sp.]
MSISILIPVSGFHSIEQSILSILHQSFSDYEILILRNGLYSLKMDVLEFVKFYFQFSCREIWIQRKGKSNALNIGIQRAKNDFICVLDADCVLQENALAFVIEHFKNQKVGAVGGCIKVKDASNSFLECIQKYEYMKTFQFVRPVFAKLNAQCLISGAFSTFRKSLLQQIHGYDCQTVGEDMEIILRIQDKGFYKSDYEIVYEPKAICFTNVPTTFKRLFHQRDRWQRGLLDCLIKHRNMIFNPLYGNLGMISMTYQVLFELLDPIVWFVYWLVIIVQFGCLFSSKLFFVYICIQFLLTIIAYIKSERKPFIKMIPLFFIITIGEVVLQIFIKAAKLYGMITFYSRRLEW